MRTPTDDMRLAMVHRPGCAKADPVLISPCTCGANVVCRTCGWGKGAIPDPCRKGNPA